MANKTNQKVNFEEGEQNDFGGFEED